MPYLIYHRYSDRRPCPATTAPLVRQLKPAGRIGIPVDGWFQGQSVFLVEKAPDGTITTK